MKNVWPWGKRLTYEQRVDEVVNTLSQRTFPVQIYFLKDGLGLGTIQINGKHKLAMPDVKPEGVINADYPRGLLLLQGVFRRTDLGFVPKGLIKDAVREAWRRKFNALQMEKAAEMIIATTADNDPALKEKPK